MPGGTLPGLPATILRGEGDCAGAAPPTGALAGRRPGRLRRRGARWLRAGHAGYARGSVTA